MIRIRVRLNKIFLLWVLFSSLNPISALAGVKINAEKLYEAGVEAYEASKYVKAMRLFEDAVRANLSGAMLKGAYLRMLKASLVLNNERDISVYQSKCKDIIPGFDVEYSQEERNLLQIIPNRDIKYTESSEGKPQIEECAAFHVANGSYAELTQEGNLKLKVTKVEIYDQIKPHLFKSTLLIQKNDERKAITSISCDSVQFPAFFDNFVINLLTFWEKGFGLEVTKVRFDGTIQHLVNEKFQEARYVTVLKIYRFSKNPTTKTVEVEVGTSLPLPGGEGQFKVLDLRENIMGLGPAVLIGIEAANVESVSFWAFLNHEQFMMKVPDSISKAPKFNPSIFKPYTFSLEKIHIPDSAEILSR